MSRVTTLVYSWQPQYASSLYQNVKVVLSQQEAGESLGHNAEKDCLESVLSLYEQSKMTYVYDKNQ